MRPVQWRTSRIRASTCGTSAPNGCCRRTSRDGRLRRLARPASVPQRRRERADTDRADRRTAARSGGGHAAPNPNFSTIELKSSDGDSWYNALIVELRRRWSRGLLDAVLVHLVEDRRHDPGVDVLLGRDQRHDVGLPGVHRPDYNKGPADWDTPHNWVTNVVWEVPFARTGPASPARC